MRDHTVEMVGPRRTRRGLLGSQVELRGAEAIHGLGDGGLGPFENDHVASRDRLLVAQDLAGAEAEREGGGTEV